MNSEKEPSKSLGVRIALGAVAVAMLGGMGFAFLPYLTSGNLGKQEGTPAFKVNDNTVTLEEIEEFKKASPIFANTEGMIGDDLKRVVVAYLIQEAAVEEDASKIKVSAKEVNDQIDQIRKQNGFDTTEKWKAALSNAGLTETVLKDRIRKSIRLNKRGEEVKASATVTEPEAQQYFELFKDNFKSEARVEARQIVVTDEKKANDLLKQAQGGADFAELARENSTELAKNDGAVGVSGEEKAPKAVARLAFPEAVAAEVFKRTEPGLTPVIKDGSKFYIVKVEKVVPAAAKTFAEAKNDVMTQAKQFKEAQVVEAWQDNLIKNAKVTFIDPTYKVEDPAVASVNGKEIKYSQVLMNLYTNQQISQFIQPGNAQAEGFINQFFKPQAVESLINQYAAVEIAQKLKKPFIGSRQQVEQSLVLFAGRDEKVTDNDVQAFYKQNQAQFAVPGSASIKEATFKDKAKALAFRDSFLKAGSDFTKDAGKAGATVNETGTVTETSSNVNAVVLQSIFKSGRLTAAGAASVSDVLEVDKKFVVVYVQDLVKPSTKTLAEVRDQIEAQLAQEKVSQKGQAFIAEERKNLKVENKLEAVLKAQQTELDAANPKALEDSKNQAEGQENTGSGDSKNAKPAEEKPAENNKQE